MLYFVFKRFVSTATAYDSIGQGGVQRSCKHSIVAVGRKRNGNVLQMKSAECTNRLRHDCR